VHNAPRRQVTSGFRLRQAAGLAPDVPLGVYLGRATKARGLDVVVSALKALPRLHFALLSSAAQDYLAELRRLAADAGVAERLHIFPYVPDVEVASAVAEADFGISPLTRYGNSDLAVPTKVLEFIHARLPMVVSDALFQADFVQQHGLGEVFSTQDPASFVKAVERILQGAYNPDWAALQQAYSWDRQFGRVVQHLEDHASNGRVPSRGVFQGPAPSAGQPGILARGLRRIGVAAQSVNLSVNRGFAFPGDVVWPAPTIGYAQPSLAVWAARRFDLFHLHFRPIISNFAGNGYEPTSFQDLGLIRQHGHRIVFQFRGSEIRINQIYRATNPFAWDEESDPSKMPDALKLTLLDTVRECADLILVPDPELQTYVPEARIVQRAVELEHLPYVGPRRQTRPRICHAPTRRDAKGTDAVLAAVQALQAEGVELDFVLLEGLPHDELMQALAEADIVVDQIVIGWYGVLAVEAMALGKAVVAYIRDDLVSELPGGVLVNASPATITERLRELVLDAGLRARLGVAARRFVEQYHASEVVARTLDGIYSELRQAPPREGSIGMFAKAFDNTLLLMAHDKRVADAKAKAKADAKAAAAKAPPAAAPAAKAAPAKPAPTPAAAKPVATPAAAKPPRTLWYRIQHASLAKLIHRIQRLTGRA
jgi:glycosyltransferase involved in cell wall biosynthesis